MLEVKGNLWSYPADVRVITTNGFVKKDGTAVMGRGCAWEATTRYPGIQQTLGSLLLAHGNHCFILRRGGDEPVLATFPVKHRWFEQADLSLIERSAHEITALADDQAWIDVWETIVIPRPGCGNGSLMWTDVKAVIENILDDRFHVITF